MDIKHYFAKIETALKFNNFRSISCKETISWITRLFLGVLLALIVFNLFVISISDINYQYPREYRDGAIVDIANQFSNNVNPYTPENSLPHTYGYGLVFPYLDSIMNRVTGLDLVDTHHIITFICLMIICLFVGIEIYRKTKSVNLTLISLAIVLSCNYVTLRPEPLAIALTVLALFIVNNKSLTFRKTLLLSSIAVILFFIKPYFVLVIAVLAVYYAFNQSKKSLIQLIVSFTLLFLMSVLIVNAIFPMYFSVTVMANLNFYNTHKISWMVKQTIDFFQLNWLITSTFILVVIAGFFRRLRLTVNYREREKPLLSITWTPFRDVYFIYALIAIIVLTLMMGQHHGTYLTYYNQLLIIPFVVFSITYGYDLIKETRFKDLARIVFIILFLLGYRNHFSIIRIDHHIENQAWSGAINYINDHDPANAYLAPIFTTEAVLRGWPIYDNGQTDTFSSAAIFDPRYMFLKPLFPMSQYIPGLMDKWDSNLKSKLSAKQFSILALPSEYTGLIDLKYLEKNYVAIHSIDVPINFGHIEFWEPKK